MPQPAAIGSFVAPALVIGMVLAATALPRTATPPPRSLPQERIDATTRTPVGMVVNWARTVLASEGNPSSVVWEQLLASPDGSKVCLAYRIGGADLRRVSFVVGSRGAKQARWEEACTGDVMQVADARQWIAMR